MLKAATSAKKMMNQLVDTRTADNQPDEQYCRQQHRFQTRLTQGAHMRCQTQRRHRHRQQHGIQRNQRWDPVVRQDIQRVERRDQNKQQGEPTF